MLGEHWNAKPLEEELAVWLGQDDLDVGVVDPRDALEDAVRVRVDRAVDLVGRAQAVVVDRSSR
jgi:hypothetical protein